MRRHSQNFGARRLLQALLIPLCFAISSASASAASILFAQVPDARRFTFPDPTAVPEPATLLLLGAGLAGGIARRRNRKR